MSALDQLEELVAVALDAERIRERERDPAVGAVRDLGGAPDGVLRRGRVPEVALEVGDRRALDQRLVDVGRVELGAGTEERAHRALGVGRDDHEAATGRRTVGRGRRVEVHARRCAGRARTPCRTCRRRSRPMNAALPPNAGDADGGVRGRAARDLGGRTHLGVDLVGAGRVDHRHRAGLDPGAGDEVVVGVREHVDERVAERQTRRSRRHGFAPEVEHDRVSPPSPCDVPRPGAAAGRRSACGRRASCAARACGRSARRSRGTPPRRAPGRGSRPRRARCSRPSACRRGRWRRPAGSGGRRRRRTSPTTPARCRSSRGTRCGRPRASAAPRGTSGRGGPCPA